MVSYLQAASQEMVARQWRLTYGLWQVFADRHHINYLAVFCDRLHRRKEVVWFVMEVTFNEFFTVDTNEGSFKNAPSTRRSASTLCGDDPPRSASARRVEEVAIHQS